MGILHPCLKSQHICFYMKKNLLYIFLATLTLSSCYRPLYRAESVYDPMLSKQGEVAANASVLVAGVYNFPSFDLNVGYSPVQSLGLKASWRNRGFNSNGSIDNDDYIRKMGGSSFEGGIGYYNRFGNNGLVSVYGNFAAGVNRDHSYYTANNQVRDRLNSRFRAFSLQPAVGMAKKNVSLVGGVRLGFYQFYDISAYNMHYTQEHYNSVSNTLYPIFEPYFNFEAGSSNIRFNFQAGFAVAPGGPDLDENFFTPKVSVGITARFGK